VYNRYVDKWKLTSERSVEPMVRNDTVMRSVFGLFAAPLPRE